MFTITRGEKNYPTSRYRFIPAQHRSLVDSTSGPASIFQHRTKPAAAKALSHMPVSAEPGRLSSDPETVPAALVGLSFAPLIRANNGGRDCAVVVWGINDTVTSSAAGSQTNDHSCRAQPLLISTVPIDV